MRIGPRATLAGTLAILVIVALALAGCVAPDTTGSSSSTKQTSTPVGTGENTIVVIQGSAFSPASVDIKVGDTITFLNRDRSTHHLAIDEVDLGKHNPLQKITWTAEKPGTFTAKCTDQPSSTGKIVVSPAQ